MLIRIAAYAVSAAAVALVAIPFSGHEVEKNVVLICDTRQHAERLIALVEANPDTALDAVNADAKVAKTCAFANITYVRSPRISSGDIVSGSFRIVPVIALDVDDASGLKSSVPAPYFMLVPLDESDA